MRTPARLARGEEEGGRKEMGTDTGGQVRERQKGRRARAKGNGDSQRGRHRQRETERERETSRGGMLTSEPTSERATGAPKTTQDQRSRNPKWSLGHARLWAR